MAINSGLKKTAASVVNEQKDDLLNQVQAAIDLFTKEATKSKKADEKQRALDAKKMLEAAVDVKDMRNRADPLSKNDAIAILKALNIAAGQTTNLEQANRSKGYDGKTFTDRRMEEAKDLATKQSVIELLTEIKNARTEEQEERTASMQKFRDVFKSGLTGFLGPAGPLVEVFFGLKEEYGADAKKLYTKFTSFLGIQKTVTDEFGMQAKQENTRREKLFDMLGNKFKKLKDAVVGSQSGGKGSIFDRLEDWFDRDGKSSKTGTGKGGSWTKAKRFGRKMMSKGSKWLSKGGSTLLDASKKGLSKGWALAGRIAGKSGLKSVGKLLGKALKGVPFLGPALGIYDLATTEEAKPDDDIIDQAGAYGNGALSGASIGAAMGAPFGGVGAIPGAAIGAVVGLVITGVMRNWTKVKDTVSKGMNFVSDLMGKTWMASKEFVNDMSDYGLKLWRGTKNAVSDIYKWLEENLPGFGKIKAVAGAVGSAVAGAATGAASMVQSMAGGGGYVPQSAGGGRGMQGVTSGGNSDSMAKFAKPSEDVKNALTGAADSVGVDKGLMMAFANQESSFNPNAKSGIGASGLGQFTDGKWSDMVRKYGKETGIGMGDRMDAKKNATMMALLIRDNQKSLQSAGVESGGGALYAMHMLGDSGGMKFMKALQSNPNGDAVSMFPEAAAANSNVFYNSDGSPKTLAQVYSWMKTKIEQPAAAYTASLAPKVDEAARVAAQTPSSNVNVTQQAAPAAAQQGGGGERGSQGMTVSDVPVVLGDNNMVVANAGMFG